MDWNPYGQIWALVRLEPPTPAPESQPLSGKPMQPEAERRFAAEVHDIIFKAGLEALEATARPWADIKRELGLGRPALWAREAPGAVSPETERIAECEHEPSSVRLGLCGRCGDPIVQIVKWVLRPGPRGDAAQ